MTIAVVLQLLQVAGVLMSAVLVLGLVFEQVGPGSWRDAATGVVCGAFAAVSVPLALGADAAALCAPAPDARVPLVLLAGLLGGTPAALLALPLPLFAGALAGGATAGSAAVVLAAAIGLAFHRIDAAADRAPGRRAAIHAAIASPLTLAAWALPELAGARVDQSLTVAATATASAVLLGGTLAVNERLRADMLRQRRGVARFRRATGHVAPAVLDGQIMHYWTLHERHGTDYAFLLVSIDDAPAMSATIGTRRWSRLQESAAIAVRRSVRASDVCAVLEFDRFGVLLPYTTLERARTVGERVRDALGAEGISASVGVADAATATSLVDVRDAAEAALYAALAAEPRGAIGPPRAPVGGDTFHSFPGAAPEGRDTPDRRGEGGKTTGDLVHSSAAR